MELREDNTICIYTPLSPKLDKRESKRLMDEISSDSRRISIDLCCVEDCTIEFIEDLMNLGKSKEIGIFNIASDIFALFNFMHLDKNVNLYATEIDFKEDTRKLVNRQFSLV